MINWKSFGKATRIVLWGPLSQFQNWTIYKSLQMMHSWEKEFKNYIRITKSKFMSLQLHNNHVTSVKRNSFSYAFHQLVPFWRHLNPFFAFQFFLAISCAMSRCCCVDNDKHFLPLFFAPRGAAAVGKKAGQRNRNESWKQKKKRYEIWFSLDGPSKPFPIIIHATLVTLKVEKWNVIQLNQEFKAH